MNISKPGLALAAALLLASTAQAAEVRREGVIISHKGGHLEVRTREGNVSVALTHGTTIRETKGAFSKTDRGPDALIPGLIITVDGDEHGHTIAAHKIQFKERDWRSAVATHAGTQEHREQTNAELARARAERAELRQAIIDGHEYVVRDEVTVYFATGSAAISESHKHQLQALAQKAPSHGNFRISILGFADPRGNAAANERLSQKRAMAVSNYLRQSGHIQPGRVLSPSAMGENGSAPDIAAPTSHDQARRVVVRVVTPKTQLRN
jgi:outer membrane protein OmpA-like peptidoglycan-associated protein